jgi:type IV pilus assembly protein PilB
MVDIGIITAEQLEKAMKKTQENGGNLGEILISEGYITEDVFVAFLGKKSDISYISLSDYGDIDSKVIAKVPESIARRKNLIPLTLKDNILTVAISDPMDIFTIDDLKAITGLKIDIVLAVKDDIKTAIEKNYESDEDFFGEFDGDDGW